MSTDSTFARSIDESARRRFEEAWRSAATPDLAAHLPPADGPLYLSTLEELVHIDLEFRWTAASGPEATAPARTRVEDYVQQFPALGQSEILRRLVAQERYVRTRCGERPDPAEYAARFPDLAEELARLPAGNGDAATTNATPPARERTMLGTARVPGYELQEVLGRGGIGVVYKAKHLRLNRLVAIKMLLAGIHAGAAERDRFEREAAAVARLDHPHIVQVFEVGEAEGRLYIVFEYVAGGNLAQKLNGAPLAAHEAAELVRTLALAMEHAHAQGIVHRDLKPTNVMLTLDGETKIGDFGLAKELTAEQGATQTGDILGTPSYMAPEQAAGRIHDIGPATDVYALGTILYEALTGRPPFRADTAWETLSQVLTAEPATPAQLQPRVPHDVETICLKCLEKDIRRRYPSAADLAADLERFLNHEPIQARPAGWWERTWRWCLRYPATALSAATIAVLLLVTAGISLWFGIYQSQVASTLSDAQAKTAEALSRSSRLSAELLFDRGTQLCEAGEIEEGLLWIHEAYRQAGPEHEALRRALRANLAAWGERLPRQTEITDLHGPIWISALSPSGRYLAVGHSYGETSHLRVYDLHTGEPLGPPVAGLVSQANGMFFSPDEKLLWLVEQQAIWPLSLPDLKPQGEKIVLARPAVFALPSGDGKMLIVLSEDFPETGGTRRSLDLYSAAKRKHLAGPQVIPDLAHLCSLPDGTLAYATVAPPPEEPPGERLPPPAARIPLLHRVRLPAWTPVHPPRSLETAAAELAVNPTGTRYVTLSPDGEVAIYDVGDGKRKSAGRLVPTETFLKLGPEYIEGRRLVSPLIRFSGDGRRIAVTSGDVVGVYAADTGGKLAMWPTSRYVVSMQFSADGARLVTGSMEGVAHVWEAVTGRPLGAPLERCWSQCAFASQDTRLASWSQDGDRLQWWDIAAAVRSSGIQLPQSGPVTHAAFLPQPLEAVTVALNEIPPGEETVVAPGDGPSEIRRFDLEGRLLGTPWIEPGEVRALAISPVRRELAIGGDMKHLRRWKVADDHAATEQAPLGGVFYSLLYSDDGRYLWGGSLIGSCTRMELDGKGELGFGSAVSNERADVIHLSTDRQGTGIAWSEADGDAYFAALDKPPARDVQLAVERPHQSVTMLPSGQGMLSGSVHPSVFVVGRDAMGSTRDIPHSFRVWRIAFSPDGRSFATGSGTTDGRLRGEVRLFDAESYAPLGSPLAHPSHVHQIQFDAAGKLVASHSGGRDQSNRGRVRISDAATNLPIGPPRAATGETRCFAFSPGGDRLLTAGTRAVAGLAAEDEPGEALLWPLPPLLDVPDERLEAWLGYVTRRRLDEQRIAHLLDDDAWRTARDVALGRPVTPRPVPVNRPSPLPDPEAGPVPGSLPSAGL